MNDRKGVLEENEYSSKEHDKICDANRRRKYRKGEHILSLDELVKQEFVFLGEKIQPKGWFMSWQFRFAQTNIGPNGRIYYAVKMKSKKEKDNVHHKRNKPRGHLLHKQAAKPDWE